MNPLIESSPVTTKVGIFLRFSGPSGWKEFQEGSRIVFHGPNHEELIISGTLITGDSSIDELTRWKATLFDRTAEVVKKNASNPALKTTSSLEPDPRVSEFECWTIRAETIQQDIVFYQSIICHQRGIVLATFEAAASPEAEAIYDRFLRTFQHL